MLWRWINSSLRAWEIHILRSLPRGVDPLYDIRRNFPDKAINAIFDVGANIGQSAVRCRTQFPTSRIWCFEPEKAAFTALSANLSGDRRTTLVNCGLGDEPCARILNRTTDPTMGHIAAGAVLPPSVQIVGCELVRIDTLDHFCRSSGINHVDYLNIDTVGYDLKVLKGAAGFLESRSVDFIMCECGMDPDNRFHCRFDVINGFMEDSGYRLFGIYDQRENWLGGTRTLRRINALFVSPRLAGKSSQNHLSSSVERLPSAAVIIPCWNAQAWIYRAIQSALNQEYPDLEVIVVDDGSTDHSPDIIRSFGNRIRWLSTPNRDACAARNTGMSLTTAEYVCFLDADDYLLPSHMLDLASVASNRPDVVIAQKQIDLVDGRLQTRTLPLRSDDGPTDFIRHTLDGKNAQTSSFLWRRTFLERIGGWNETMPRLQDIEVAIRAFFQNPSIAVSPGGAAVYVDHSGNERISRRHTREVLENDVRYMSRLTQQMAACPADVRAALGRSSYYFAGMAYRYGADDIADAHLKIARANGLKGHMGSFPHLLLATVLGLRRKSRFTGWVRSIQRRYKGIGLRPTALPPLRNRSRLASG